MKNIIVLFILTHLVCISISAQDLEIDTLLNHGSKDNRINFAFANVDHATANSYTEKAEFLSDLEEIVERFNPDSPLRKNGYSQYNNFFNIYSVWFNDPFVFEAIPSYYQQSQAVIDNLFLPWADNEHGWVTMMYSLKGGGGGGAGRRDDLRRGDALIWGLDWETILHEFNHTMTGVGDEYTASGAWSNYVCNESANQTPALSREDVPWRNWIGEDIPIPTPYSEEYFDVVGAFEGTISGYFGCQRPTAQSCYMGAGGFGDGFGQDMCSVCLQRFICRLYLFVDAIENEMPAQQTINVVANESVTFAVETVKPIPNTQQYKWYLNGKIIASNVTSVDITFGECPEYELTFELLDTTGFVRYDEKYAHFYPEPRQTHSWIITNNEAMSSSMEAIITSVNADCTGDATGKLIIEPSGGQAPYTFIIDGTEYTTAIENLSVGSYQIHILDVNGCRIVKEAEIKQDQIMDYDLVSEFKNGVWKIYPLFKGDNDGADYNFQWSNGSNEHEIYVTEKGSYSLEVMINENCQNVKTIELSATPCASLSVTYDAINPSPSWYGAIHLQIINGSAPYEIRWNKNVAKDLTSNNPEATFSSGNDQIAIHLTEYLFDDIISFDIDFWAEGFTGANYAGYDFGQPTSVDFYSLTSNVDVKGRDAKNWTFQGSNDMNTWDILDTQADITFDNRLEKQEFLLAQEYSYQYYRIFITENNGDGWIAIQEMEFGSTKNPEEIKSSKNQPYLTELSAGPYNYIVTDANGNRQSADVLLSEVNSPVLNVLKVIQSGPDKVMIEAPQEGIEYLWFADAESQVLLYQGDSFQPLNAGNYFVNAVEVASQGYASETKGFAVTMQPAPEVSISNGTFTIINPVPDAEYYWYDKLTGGAAIHSGTDFTTSVMGDYYVSMRLSTAVNTLIDPGTLNGISLWADASDIDGNNQLDQGLKNSSAYLWKFRINGQWDPSGWHAYRSNYANGLGVVELATVWFQYIQNVPVPMRSLIVVYEENGFSREGSAPFYGLKNYIGRNNNQDQLFYNDVSDATKNGRVHINGQEVDPLSTFNSYEMKSLSVVLDQTVDLNLYACDEYWEGKIAEFISFDRTLTDDELKGVHAYLRKKWLSTADLDSPRTMISWTDGNISYASSEEVALCYGEHYFGLTEAGIYIREMKTSEGYDSTVTTTLLVSELNPNAPPEIATSGNILSISTVASSYQWYLEGAAINNASESEYTAISDGMYSVVVTDSYGCSVESDPINFVLSTLDDSELLRFKVYPNPTADFISIEKEGELRSDYILTNSVGHILKRGVLSSQINVLDVSGLPRGMYVIRIEDGSLNKSIKLMKLP